MIVSEEDGREYGYLCISIFRHDLGPSGLQRRAIFEVLGVAVVPGTP